ncbi:MAG: dUTP diphosphatase [Atopobiaceae bacterium]|nr:dUTP diphosphatase [Atopobiaceae bacterium]
MSAQTQSDAPRIVVPIKRLDPTVELPSYAYAGDAGLDLRSSENVTLKPFERRLISTGLAIAIPEGYAGFVQPRSGLALKQGLSMANTPGLIDAHYRGELKICAINLDPDNNIVISKGDRIAQLVIQQVPIVQLNEVDELDATDRGEGGFGSSGVSQ